MVATFEGRVLLVSRSLGPAPNGLAQRFCQVAAQSKKWLGVYPLTVAPLLRKASQPEGLDILFKILHRNWSPREGEGKSTRGVTLWGQTQGRKLVEAKLGAELLWARGRPGLPPWLCAKILPIPPFTGKQGCEFTP